MNQQYGKKSWFYFFTKLTRLLLEVPTRHIEVAFLEHLYYQGSEEL